MNKVFYRSIIVSNPEIRYTSSNIPYQSFNIALDDSEIKVFLSGKVVNRDLQKGNNLVIEGKLAITKVENKKVFQISGHKVILLENNLGGYTNPDFGDEELSDDLVGDDEIPF